MKSNHQTLRGTARLTQNIKTSPCVYTRTSPESFLYPKESLVFICSKLHLSLELNEEVWSSSWRKWWIPSWQYTQWIPYQPCLLQHITLLLCIALSHFLNLLFNFDTAWRKEYIAGPRLPLNIQSTTLRTCQALALRLYVCIGIILNCILPWFL